MDAMGRWRWRVALAAGVASAALISYVLISEAELSGGCSSGESMFAYTVYGREMIRSTDVAVFSGGKEERVTDDGQSGDPSFNPDGSRVVFSTGRLGLWDPEYGRGENGFERRALFTTSTSTFGQGDLLTSGPFDTEPDWSPDGSKVVFVREGRYGEGDDELWIVDVQTRKERLLLRFPNERHRENQFRSPAWSPDGRQIAFFHAPHDRGKRSVGVWLINRDGSNLRRLPATTRTGGDQTWSDDLSWSPAGNALAFDGATELGNGIHALELAESHTRLLNEDAGYPAWSPDGSRIAFFDLTWEGSNPSWRLMTTFSQGSRMEPVEGSRPVEFYAYEELDWTCK
jgi:Tol biopolymer transport system component